MLTTYIVTMNRVGQNHNVPPLAVVAPSDDTAEASALVAEALYLVVARKHCASRELMTAADVVTGHAAITAEGRNAGEGRIYKADVCTWCDESCPSCDYPETYVAGQYQTDPVGPFAEGCRKCGWVELLTAKAGAR